MLNQIIAEIYDFVNRWQDPEKRLVSRLVSALPLLIALGLILLVLTFIPVLGQLLAVVVLAIVVWVVYKAIRGS